MKRFKSIFLTLLMMVGLGFGLQAQVPEWTAPETVAIFDAFAPQPINLHAVKAEIEYPRHAVDQWMEGRVVVRVLVDEDGAYLKHEVLTTPSETLSKAVEKTVSKLQFEPARLEGQPLQAWVNIPFDFRITE